MSLISKDSFSGKLKNRKIFYGWWILGVTCLLTALLMSFFVYSISVIFKPLALSLGLNRALTSLGGGLGFLVGGAQGPISGWLSDKINPKKIMIFGAALMGLGLFLAYFINSAWTYFTIWIMIAIGVNIALTVPSDKVLIKWFARRRGLIISIKFSFVSIGGVAIVPVITWLTLSFGWQMACVIWGFVAVLAIPLIWLFIKAQGPEYYGLKPDGARPEITSANNITVQDYTFQSERSGLTLGESMKTAAFWIILIATAGQFAVQNAIIVHTIPFLTDRGIDATSAGALMSLSLFFGIPPRILTGILADRLQKNSVKYMIASSMFIFSIGIAVIILQPASAMIYVFLILIGISSGIPTSLATILRVQYFGQKSFGAISGMHLLLTSPLAVAAPVYIGWVYDGSGNYLAGFTVFTIICAACALLMCFARPPKKILTPALAEEPLQKNL